MLDRRLVEDIAIRLDTDAGLIEKDWHVVRALGILATLDQGDVQAVFSGGTSLSIAWRIIKRLDAAQGLPRKSAGEARSVRLRADTSASLRYSASRRFARFAGTVLGR